MQSQRIILSQRQQLKLSPQMYQSLELLAMPILDLKAKIRDEIEKNPALELTSSSDISYERYTKATQKSDYDFFENSSDPGYVRKASHVDENAKHQFMEGALYRTESLQQHLLDQLRLFPLTEERVEIGELIISNLDHNGFHQEDPYSILPEGTDINIVDTMINIIQRFDPPGICVKDFTQSLVLQCELEGPANKLSVRIIEDHLQSVKRGKIDLIVKELQASVEEIEEAITFIKTLNPFPGSLYSHLETQYVIPDLVITKIEDQLTMKLNTDQIPSLSIDAEFEHILDDEITSSSKETEKYVQKALKDATWLINSIQMRNATLRKVGAALIKYQFDFYVHGPKYLRPLTLKNIAEEVSVHETTISRISNAKYIQTDFGIFPIKYFFTNAVAGKSDDGKEISKIGVKEVIREIIEDYTGKKKLSDQKISDLLKEKDISVARRTVAKYRKELNIDSSFHRN